jgi:2-succinyl-5-enolpyruvyl-6-hydroxy-3-cyclohexene-1-carboxylate synthase
MGLGDISLACARALVDELVGGGVRHACLSPGSRSTPLALALARDPRIQLHVHLDERASAFFALGIAKASGEPVIAACTSGTAAAEFLPAVVEASQSRVPLVLLTADRPPRLRGTGANQTIDQAELYGKFARAYIEPPVPERAEDAAEWRAAGRRALLAMASHPPGPVHVNCPFDEPLIPEGEEVEAPASGERPPPAQRSLAPSEQDVERFVEATSGKRVVVVAGGAGRRPSSDFAAMAASLGWPLVAEPQSGLRTPGVLSAGQALIGNEAWLAEHRPQVVVQIGAAPTTRATQNFVATAERLTVVDDWHLEPDPEGRAALRIGADPDQLASTVEDLAPVPEGWVHAWRAADTRARTAMDEAMDGWTEPFEPRIARDLAAAIPDGGTLFVGNSTPIRDLDLAMAPRDGLRILTNRGASGIDGLAATTLGIARSGAPTFALMGDLSFLYDAGALLWSGRSASQAVFVVISNGGGQVFSLLPKRDLPEHEELFVTPHPASIGKVCAAAGADHISVGHSAGLVPSVQEAGGETGVRVIEVEVDPNLGRERRDEMRLVATGALSKG